MSRKVETEGKKSKKKNEQINTFSTYPELLTWTGWGNEFFEAKNHTLIKFFVRIENKKCNINLFHEKVANMFEIKGDTGAAFEFKFKIWRDGPAEAWKRVKKLSKDYNFSVKWIETFDRGMNKCRWVRHTETSTKFAKLVLFTVNGKRFNKYTEGELAGFADEMMWDGCELQQHSRNNFMCGKKIY
jgi:DNA-binding ferritin-like protein (Dps family)